MPRHPDKNSTPPSNRLRSVREELMLSKAELARRAGVSPLTIDRIEDGENCRMDTKRKIILALGMKLTEKDKVFTAEAEPSAAAKATEKMRP